LLAVDEGLATLLSALRATGRLNDAVVIFTSDNGFLLGEHRLVKKGEAYDESAKVPLLFRWPGVRGRAENRLASLVDVPATICAAAGTTAPGVDGVDLAGLVTARTKVRNDTYIAAPRDAWHAVRTPRWLYLEAGTERELYDVVADPYQLSSVAGLPAHAAVEAQLARRLARRSLG
jgi:arylsulfatase A-like enzyme